MHIIITLAGHSRRFQAAGYALPKCLIDIDGRPMVAHVTEMFDPEDYFHFVINSAQEKEFPQLSLLLRTLARRVSITVIEPHEQGPTFSALQVVDVPPDEPVIISYCDFRVVWDYAAFRRTAADADGVVPAFRGFHPASFGDTHYAYMRVDAQGHMLELREKKSFTGARHEEFASAGLYYFRDWAMFRHYAERLQRVGFGSMKEGYTSLLMNPMVEDGLRVFVTEVEQFICWGTPEDLAQYQFWSGYFHGKPQKMPVQKQTNLIPMAGRGSRFRQAGYAESKPLIPVRGSPMAITACRSFPAAGKWVFLPRKEDAAALAPALRKFAPGSHVLPVAGDTSGQAATCLLAEDAVDSELPLFIASCDYAVRFDVDAWQELVADKSIDAVIWTARLKHVLAKSYNAFAYCDVAADGSVRRVVEKKTLTEMPWNDAMVTGSFWFRHAGDFMALAARIIEENVQVSGEHYIANGMNMMIAEGRRVVAFDVQQWVPFGDPFELRVLEYWEAYFSARPSRAGMRKETA